VTVIMDARTMTLTTAPPCGRSCDAFGVQHLHDRRAARSFLASTTVATGSERWVDVHGTRD
jgi:tRNA (guanosine-2'-O-)-methyltransferase